MCFKQTGPIRLFSPYGSVAILISIYSTGLNVYHDLINKMGWRVSIGEFLVPSILIFGTVIFIPNLWYRWVIRRTSKTIRAFLLFLGIEIFMLLLVFLDLFFRTSSWTSSLIIESVKIQLVFYGPTIAFISWLIAHRVYVSQERESFRELAQVAQARALQGQLHPHVLFNALNGLAELIHKKSDQAEESVRHLSDLLRKVLRATDDPEYSLRKERSLLEDYLQMESFRLGRRLRLGWDWDPAMEELVLPPMLLQPLVENALKHGIAPCREGGELRIQARREGSQVLLCVRNTGMPLSFQPGDVGTSIGIPNLQSRLKLAFGNEARFSLRAEGGWVVAEISLPWGALA